MDHLCGYRVYGDRTNRHRQVESLEKASCKGGGEDGCWSGSGRQGRGEKKKKISGGMEEEWTACVLEKCREIEKKADPFISL